MTINNKNQPLQAAVYGVGLCAEYGGSVFKPLVGGRLLFSCLVYFLFLFFCSYLPVCLWMNITFQFCLPAEALSRLDIVIRNPNSQHSDNVMAYDNAVSALGKICQFHRDSIDASQVKIFYCLIHTFSNLCCILVFSCHSLYDCMFTLHPLCSGFDFCD